MLDLNIETYHSSFLDLEAGCRALNDSESVDWDCI